MTRPALIEQLESRLFMSGVVSGDFTGDGVTDLVTTQGGLKLRVGTGNGTFRVGVPISGVGFARGAGVAAADFDTDGSLDLVVFGGTSTTTALKRAAGTRIVNGGLFVLFNNGNGIFQRPMSVSGGTINSTRIIGGQVTTGDFNQDGNQDILVTNATSTIPSPFSTPTTGFAFGGVTGSNSGFFVTSGGSGFFLGIGSTNLLGGMSAGGGFLGTTGTFVPGGTTTPTTVGILGSPAARTSPTTGIVSFMIAGNGDGTFQAPRRIVLT